MLAATFVGVILTCFAGEITCNELEKMGKSVQGCNDNEFHDPGYAKGCKYHCTSGDEGETQIQEKEYRNATVCVEFEDNDDTKLHHVGVCFNGICMDHRTRCPGCTESDLEQRWSSLPELAAEFHRCTTLKQSTAVENCLYVCKDTHDNGKGGYFYGIYDDGNPCKLAEGNEGVCRSGWCYTKDVINPHS
uniref:Putative basic tail protein n=1 Tax=Ixodes ricinus TaxID=34613 RepID=A0A0K8R8M1_IXORI